MSIFRPATVSFSLVQMNVVMSDPDCNLAEAARGMAAAAERNSSLVVLPQAFATGVDTSSLRKLAEPIPGGRVCSFLAEHAARFSLHIIAGILEKDGRDVYDSAVLIAPTGELLGRYRRWFLWSGEQEFLSPGGPSTSLATDLGRIGLLLGYDLEFPESCRGYFSEGVDLLVCPSGLLRRATAELETLCRARALENHCYFLFCNAVGYHALANDELAGHSVVTCDPRFLVYELRHDPAPGVGLLGGLARVPGILHGVLHVRKLQACKHKSPQRQDLAAGLERAATV